MVFLAEGLGDSGFVYFQSGSSYFGVSIDIYATYLTANMATREQITTALLTEHLRYTPLALLDDIINTVNELVYQAVNNIETALLSVPPNQLGFALEPTKDATTGEDAEEELEQAARTEIEGGIVKLESLLNATVDKDFDKLEIYTLRNLLTVSNAKDDEGLEDWIMLDHYKVSVSEATCMMRHRPTQQSEPAITRPDSRCADSRITRSITSQSGRDGETASPITRRGSQERSNALSVTTTPLANDGAIFVAKSL